LTLKPATQTGMSYGRVVRHVCLAALGSAILFAFCLGFDDRTVEFQLSIGSAYAACIFLATTLLLGPVYAIWRRRRPVSTYLRRDLAIWAGVFALLHTGAGLLVHFGGRIWPYFFDPAAGSLTPRFDLFGLTNYAGLVSTLAIAGLLLISSDAAMRRLGVGSWKKLQQLAPWAGLVALAHAAAYQLLEDRSLPFIVFLAAAAALVVALRLSRQIFGARVSGCRGDPV